MIRWLLLFLTLVSPALAQSISWAGPSSVVSTVRYPMTAIAPAELTVYKNGQYFAYGYYSAGSSSIDVGVQTVDYVASGMSGDNTVYYSGATSVSIHTGSPPSTPSVSASPSTMYPSTSFSASGSFYDGDGDLDSYGLRYQGYGLIAWGSAGSEGSSTGSLSASHTAHGTAGMVVRVRGEVWDKNGHGVTGDWVEYPVQAISTSFGFSGSSFTYDGGTKSVSVSASPSGASYSTSGTYSATNAGSYTASATATGNYSGSGSHSWTINPASQNSVWSSNDNASAGQPFSPNFYGGSGSGSWIWYVVGETSWNDDAWTPSSPGNYTFYVRKNGDGNYYDSDTAGGYALSVTGVSTSFTFSGGPSFTYNGSAKTVSVSPSPAGATYSTSGTYSATNAGTYTASATANGSYAGSGSYNWSIVKAEQGSVTITPSSQTIPVGQSITFNASGGSGTGAYTWGGDASGTASSKTITFNTAGTRTVTVYRAGDSNYNPSNTATATITVNNLTPQPTVTITPTSQSIGLGQSITFTAAGGAGAGVYNWSGDASGTGSAKSVTFNTAGTRTVTVQRAGDGTYAASNSASATVTVIPPPTISAQPQSREVTTGETTTFSVTATGTSLGYQWRKNGTNVAGATSRTLTLIDTLPQDAGIYDVFVYNNYGTVSSSPAALTVNEPPVVLAAFQPTSVSQTQVVFSAAVKDVDSNLRRVRFFINFPPAYNGYHQVATADVSGAQATGQATWNPSATTVFADGITEFPQPMPSGRYHVWARAEDTDNAIDSNGGAFTYFDYNAGSQPTLSVSPYQVAVGHTVTVNYQAIPSGSSIGLWDSSDSNTVAPRLYQGVSGASGSTTFTLSSQFVLGRVYHARLFPTGSPSNQLGTSNGFVLVDRWGLTVVDGRGGASYASSGAVVEIEANFAPSGQAFTGWTKVEGPGTLADSTAAFTTFTMGSGNATIRAQFTGIPQITSALNASGDLEFPFSYTLTASNSPTNFTAGALPAGLTFEVLQNPTRGRISGTPAVYGSFNIPVSASNAAGTGNGLLALEISSSGGPPDIMRPPQSRAVVSGSTTTFTVAATSEIAMTFQWQRKANGAASFVDISSGGTYAGGSGPIAVTLTVSGTTLAMSGDQYRCVVSNSAGPTTSSVATLTVGTADTTNQNQLNVHLPTSP